MKMIEIDGSFFDPYEIMESGQCFRWKETAPDEYSVISDGRYLKLKKDNGKVFAFTDEVSFANYWKSYLDLDRDYGNIKKLIDNSSDEHLKEAFKLGSGIRILKQDLWEMIVSFMVSQNNNIPRIKGSIEAICEKAGLKIEVPYGVEYRFPGPGEVNPGFFDDRSLGLGYRAPYLEEIYQFAKDNPSWLSGLYSLSYEDSVKELLIRKGIGPKVANCIALFGLHHVDAFPIDTHVKQLLDKYYPEGFDFDYYKGVAGIIQQYLFYYELITK